jgi:hypothetical protein
MNQQHFTRRRMLTGLAAGGAVLPFGWRRAAAQTPEIGEEPETLFVVTFPRDWQPEGEAQGAYYRITLEPGQSLTYLPGPYCGCTGETIQEGTAAERVLSGTSYTVRLDRLFILRRDGGEDEEVAAGTEVELTAGDVAVYPDALAFGDLTNSGDDTIVLFGASITSLEFNEGTFTPPLPEEMSARLSVAVWDAWQNLGGGDIDATLTRRVLPAGEALDPYEIVGLEAIHVQSGELHSSVIHPGESTPTADPRYISPGGTVAFREQTPGTQRLLANPFEEPAVLLTLTFNGSAESNG